MRVHSGIGFRGIGLLYAADGTYEMTDSPTDGNDICSPWAGGCEVQTGGFELYLAVQYDKDPPDQSACAPNQDFDFPSGDECQYIFKTIMNGCELPRSSNRLITTNVLLQVTQIRRRTRKVVISCRAKTSVASSIVWVLSHGISWIEQGNCRD